MSDNCLVFDGPSLGIFPAPPPPHTYPGVLPYLHVFPWFSPAIGAFTVAMTARWCCWFGSHERKSRTWYPVRVDPLSGDHYIVVLNPADRSTSLNEWLAHNVDKPLVLTGPLAGSIDVKKGFNICTKARELSRKLVADLPVSASVAPASSFVDLCTCWLLNQIQQCMWTSDPCEQLYFWRRHVVKACVDSSPPLRPRLYATGRMLLCLVRPCAELPDLLLSPHLSSLRACSFIAMRPGRRRGRASAPPPREATCLRCAVSDLIQGAAVQPPGDG